MPPVEDKPGTAPAAIALAAAPDLAQPAVSEAGKAVAPASYGVPVTDARIVVRAVADSWIEVRDGQGNLLITRFRRETRERSL